MSRRPLVRAAALASALVIALAGIAAADTVRGDADVALAGTQNGVDLGEVAPGASVAADVGFTLTCKGLAHADRGQTVTFAPTSSTVPLDGAAGATTGAVGPVPDAWPADGEGCPYPAPVLGAATPSRVTLTVPEAPGRHTFTIFYDFALTPAGVDDAGALAGPVAVDVVVTVVEPPQPPPVEPPPVEPPPVEPPAPPPVPADVRAQFRPPLARGELTVPRWVRVLPVVFRLDPADVVSRTAPPSLALVPYRACDAKAPAGPERSVRLRAVGRGRWMGLADLRGLAGTCARLEVRVAGVVAGSARVLLRP
ncbi:MAG: hypothetical protein MUE92_00975 [Chloroflexi bacterium]|jgi:hypothetical protein|nr:hypothetical protein [Chloroflexota bacterium]